MVHCFSAREEVKVEVSKTGLSGSIYTLLKSPENTMSGTSAPQAESNLV